MTDYRRIMSLLLEGRSYREIGAITACSQTTIRTAKRVIDAEGLTLDRVRRLTDAEIAGLFPDGRSRVKGEYDDPDFARVVASFKKNQHFTLLQGWLAVVYVTTVGAAEVRVFAVLRAVQRVREKTRSDRGPQA